MNEKDILDVISGPASKDNKWYHCPYCSADFNYMDILNGIDSEPVDTHNRIYKCKKCKKLFRMPE